MSTTQVTIFMIVVVLVFIAVDIYLFIDGSSGNTYSEILRQFGKERIWFIMLMCFGFGLLAGHWWW